MRSQRPDQEQRDEAGADDALRGPGKRAGDVGAEERPDDEPAARDCQHLGEAKRLRGLGKEARPGRLDEVTLDRRARAGDEQRGERIGVPLTEKPPGTER